MREYGPILGCRWDPHPEPVGNTSDETVLYAAADPASAFAEAFQRTRAITLTGTKALVGWKPDRPLELLDLTGTWALRNGASGSLDSAPRSTCRAWARGIRSAFPELDGLYTLSTMTRRPLITLFAPARDSFPVAPDLARPLTHPAIVAIARAISAELTWPARRY